MQPWIQQLEEQSQQFAAVLAEGDLAAAVPPCPGWSLADLGDHLGGVYQWAAHAITAGKPDAVVEHAPRERPDLVRWYSGHADRLVEVLRSTPADAPAWGFGPKPRTVSFWARRQVHETTMHLWDAHTSQGASYDVPEQLALDGLDEVLTVFFPRQVRLGRIPALEQALALQVTPPVGAGPADAGPADAVPVGAGSTDAEAPSRFVLQGDGTGTGTGTVETPDDESADATVSGPASALLLLLWKRIGLDDVRLTVRGDAASATAVLSQDLTP